MVDGVKIFMVEKVENKEYEAFQEAFSKVMKAITSRRGPKPEKLDKEMQKLWNWVSKELISVSEAAQIRGIAPASIYELIGRGRLNLVEISGKKLLIRSEVMAFERAKPGPRSKREKTDK